MTVTFFRPLIDVLYQSTSVFFKHRDKYYRGWQKKKEWDGRSIRGKKRTLPPLTSSLSEFLFHSDFIYKCENVTRFLSSRNTCNCNIIQCVAEISTLWNSCHSCAAKMSLGDGVGNNLKLRRTKKKVCLSFRLRWGHLKHGGSYCFIYYWSRIKNL